MKAPHLYAVTAHFNDDGTNVEMVLFAIAPDVATAEEHVTGFLDEWNYFNAARYPHTESLGRYHGEREEGIVYPADLEDALLDSVPSLIPEGIPWRIVAAAAMFALAFWFTASVALTVWPVK